MPSAFFHVYWGIFHMPDLYRVTTVFSGKKKGWSESFILSQDGTTPGGIMAGLTNILQLRANLLGSQFQVDGARVAKIRLANGDPVKRQVILREQAFTPKGIQENNDADAPDGCVIAVSVDAGGTHKRQFFLGAPPDDVIVKGGELDFGHAWNGRFSTWTDAMKALGAGWLQSINRPEKQVTNYVIDAGGICTFTCEAGTFGAGPYKRQVVRIHGLNSKHSTYNGAMLVLPLSDTTAQMINARFGAPFLSRGFITTYQQPLPFVQGALYGAVKAGNHKRGRPLFSSPGRRPAVVRV